MAKIYCNNYDYARPSRYKIALRPSPRKDHHVAVPSPGRHRADAVSTTTSRPPASRPGPAIGFTIAAILFIWGGVASLPLGMPVVVLGIMLAYLARRAYAGKRDLGRRLAIIFFGYMAASCLYVGLPQTTIVLIVGGLAFGALAGYLLKKCWNPGT